MSVDDRHWNLTEDQEELRLRVRQLAVEVVAPRAAEVDRTEAYPWTWSRPCGRQGLWV